MGQTNCMGTIGTTNTPSFIKIPYDSLLILHGMTLTDVYTTGPLRHRGGYSSKSVTFACNKLKQALSSPHQAGAGKPHRSAAVCHKGGKLWE